MVVVVVVVVVVGGCVRGRSSPSVSQLAPSVGLFEASQPHNPNPNPSPIINSTPNTQLTWTKLYLVSRHWRCVATSVDGGQYQWLVHVPAAAMVPSAALAATMRRPLCLVLVWGRGMCVSV